MAGTAPTISACRHPGYGPSRSPPAPSPPSAACSPTTSPSSSPTSRSACSSGSRGASEENGGEEHPGARPQARHWSFSWFPSHDPEGAISGVALIAVDVTERRNSEEAVRRSEERYRSLVQAGAQVVWVTTPTGEIAEDSPEWRWITGQSLEEYLGNGWLDAVHPEDRERVERDWRECVGGGKIFDSRYRVRTKTGSYRHYDVRAVPIERDGKIIEWVGASTDVTAQREAEEMRGRLTEQLSAAALRTARLQQATSMLAEALTVEQVVEVITEVGRSAIGADRSAVALLDPERLRVRTVNPGGLPDSPGHPGGDIPLDIPSVVTLAITTRRPVLVENPDGLRRTFADVADLDLFLSHTDERAWVGMPLLAAGSAIGALRFSFSRPRKITDEERVFLEALAGQCALALERASLFEREHTTAETLQRSLLPDRLPSVPGIILDARYLPVTRNMEIGGDWYDAFRLPDGRLAVAAGDVMGKGLSAAAGMGRVRNALRALALTDPRPGRRAGRSGPAVHRHRARRAGDHGRLPGVRPGVRGGPGRQRGPSAAAADVAGRAAPAGPGRGGDAAGLGQPAPAVRVPAAPGAHGRAVLRRPGGEPAARAALRPGRTGRGGRAGDARGGGGSRQPAGVPG